MNEENKEKGRHVGRKEETENNIDKGQKGRKQYTLSSTQNLTAVCMSS
jgi:hypothetical protein